MLNSFPIAVIVGIVLGYLAGIGVGGGTLLILWLTTIIGEAPSTARTINLMFFIFSAGAVSIFRWKRGKLDFHQILPAAIAGCAAAGLFAWIGNCIDAQPLKKIFGFLLLFTGIREMLYRPRKLR